MADEIHELLQSYIPSPEATKIVRQSHIILLVGISGAGKDTLKQHLLKLPGFYNFVSHTTRSPRENHGVLEQNGIDYHFITKEQARDMLQQGKFIEAKQYSGNIYGTAVDGLLRDSDKIAVNDVEVQGVEEYKKLSSDVRALFILPPSPEEWLRRLTGRHGKTVDTADIELRKKTAVSELRSALRNGYFDFVINDDLDQTVRYVTELASRPQTDEERKAGRKKADELLQAISTH